MDRAKRQTLAVGVVLVAIAIVVALSLNRMHDQPGYQVSSTRNHTLANNTSTQIANISGSPDSKTIINVLSSPSAFPFVQRWVAQYNLEQTKAVVNIIYSPEVDRAATQNYANITRLLYENSADIAIVGSAQLDNASLGNSSVFIPASPQAVAVVYNIPSFPDIPSGLKLDSMTLQRILTGNITYWDDKAITSKNEDLNLPHQRIIVVHPNKVESSTGLVASYIFNNRSEIRWPSSSLAAQDVAKIATLVEQTPFSIGYIDFAYAVQTRMTFAALENSDEKYVLPSTISIGYALQNGTRIPTNMTSNETAGRPFLFLGTPPSTDLGHMGNGSYPLVGLYSIALARSELSSNSSLPASNGTASYVSNFVNWINSDEGQQIVRDTQYPSVYDSKTLKSYLVQERFGNQTGSTS